MRLTLILIALFALLKNSHAQAPALVYQKVYGGGYPDQATFAQRTKDGGLLLGGTAVSNDGDVSGNYGSYDYWIIKVRPDGTLQWQKSYGGTRNDFATSGMQASDGGYIIAGYTNSQNGAVIDHYSGDYAFWVVKLDTSGYASWQRTYGGNGDDKAYAVKQTLDGGYIVAGTTKSNNSGDITGNHANGDYWMLKINAQGTKEWQKTFGGSGLDECYSIEQTADGGYVLCGTTESNDGDVTGKHGVFGGDMWVIKTTGDGTMQWQKCLGGSAGETGYSVKQVADGGYIVAGESSSLDGDVSHVDTTASNDCWVVKLNASGNIQWQQCYGGTGEERANAIIQLADKSYAIGGYSSSVDFEVTGNHGGQDFWILNISQLGKLVWQKSLGGSAPDKATCLFQATDGGIIAAGVSGSTNGDVIGHKGSDDYWLIKLAGDGKIRNIKAGNWSDAAVWPGNKIPGTGDDVILDYDITVDIDGTCKSLTLNGHKVNVNKNVKFAVNGF